MFQTTNQTISMAMFNSYIALRRVTLPQQNPFRISAMHVLPRLKMAYSELLLVAARCNRAQRAMMIIKVIEAKMITWRSRERLRLWKISWVNEWWFHGWMGIHGISWWFHGWMRINGIEWEFMVISMMDAGSSHYKNPMEYGSFQSHGGTPSSLDGWFRGKSSTVRNGWLGTRGVPGVPIYGLGNFHIPWLVGGRATPLKNMSSSIGMMTATQY